MSGTLRITCACCNKQVDRITLNTHGHLPETLFELAVECHGRTDRMTFTGYDIVRHGQEAWTALMNSEGVAFQGEAVKRQRGDVWDMARFWAQFDHAADAMVYARQSRSRSGK